MNLKKWKGIYE